LFNAQPQAPATKQDRTALVAGACGWALNEDARELRLRSSHLTVA